METEKPTKEEIEAALSVLVDAGLLDGWDLDGKDLTLKLSSTSPIRFQPT